ncbi:MAG: ABC transporter ATP-binding protein [Acidimicrobiia bacterium]
MSNPVISATNIAVYYGDDAAVHDFSLDVEQGSLMVLVGPSGCGKTTALRAIAGFEPVATGTISVRGSLVSSQDVLVAPEHRSVGMVFQEYALFPHISVAENVGYGVRGSDRGARVAEVLRLVGLEDLSDWFPHELSGGEQQRVALARALAPEPDVVLLDEPFSNLDAPQRERMRRELRKILKAARATAVLVTHDQAEALAIADVIAVMRNGAISQVGEPGDVYASPVSPWVGKFLGDAVILEGTAEKGVVPTSLGPVPTELADGSPAEVMIRPEWITPSVADDGGIGRIVDREFYGHDQRVEIELVGGDLVEALVSGRSRIHVGDNVDIEVDEAIVYAR